MKKILLVEDDEYVSRMFGRAFKIGGFDVEFAADGVIALNMLMAAPTLPQAVVMDANMPNMNGNELIKRIKAEPHLKDLIIVILTNSSLKDEEKTFISLNADLYLVKIEHSSKEVVRMVEELLVKKGLITA